MNIYGIHDKLHSVDTTKGSVISRDEADNKYLYNSNYRRFGGADYRGYIEEGSAYVAPYNGRYGKGVAVAIHEYYHGKTSSEFMQVIFCIEKEEVKPNIKSGRFVSILRREKADDTV